MELALVELRKLEGQSQLYAKVLKAVASGFRRWSEIKRAAEVWMGRPIPDQNLSRILKNLRKMSVLDKNNEFLDPVVEEAAKKL